MIEPLVSAVIITYNQEKYIEQTIECALAQIVDFEYEIIIGEDCSTDGTREICLQYQKKYPNIIRLITSDNNVGLLDNWYRTVKAAAGKYIAGCGGDDYWHNQRKIKKQAYFLENNPCYGMIHSECDLYIQKKKQTIINYHAYRGNHLENSKNATVERILQGEYPIIASSAVFRKQLFDKYFDIDKFKINNFLMEDTPLWIEISANSKIFYLRESLATYRFIENSFSRQNNEIKKLLFQQSSAAMRIYFCDKLNFPSYKIIHEKNWRRSTLKLALLSNQVDLAKLVKEKYNSLTFKENLLYIGAKYRFARFIFFYYFFLKTDSIKME